MINGKTTLKNKDTFEYIKWFSDCNNTSDVIEFCKDHLTFMHVTTLPTGEIIIKSKYYIGHEIKVYPGEYLIKDKDGNIFVFSEKLFSKLFR